MVKIRRTFRQVGTLLASIGVHLLKWAKNLVVSIYYRTSLRVKILIPVFLITLLVIGTLSWFSFVNIQSTIAEIYEQRARSVAAVVSKSIKQKEYILYYSEKLDEDIGNLLKRYENLVQITIVTMTGRGLRVVASTDPTKVGQLVSEDKQEKFSLLREIEISRVQYGNKDYLRAYHPLVRGSDLLGVVSLDMSLKEQQGYLSSLLWQLGVSALVGFLILGTLLYMIIRIIITRPVFRLAKAAQAVSGRNYDIEVSAGPERRPGTPVRDELAKFIDVFNLMIKTIYSREETLREMVVLDEQTGVYNLAHFKERLSEELQRGQRYKHPTSLLLIEVRGTEQLEKEDQEEILLTTANFLIGNLRSVDPIFRVGTIRFAALLSETPADGAQVAADRLKERSADLTLTSDFAFSLRIVATGWSQEETPEVEDVLRWVSEPLKNNQG